LHLAPLLVPWVLALTGCRLSYELLDNSDGSLGGAGSGPSSVGGTSAGSGPGLGGAGDPGDGGTGGDAATGGTSTSGGASTGGVAASGGGDGGGTGGVGSGGAGSGGAGSGGTSGSGGSGGSLPIDFPISTTADENDAGATVGDPGQTGLSLREAITLANSTPGSQTIGLDSGTYVLDSVLPLISEGLILAGGNAILDFSAASTATPCLQTNTSDVSIQEVEIRNCQGEAVYMGGTSATGLEVLRSSFHDNGAGVMAHGMGTLIEGNLFTGSGTSGVALYGTDAQVRDNEIFDSGSQGIYLSAGADGVVLMGNLLVRSDIGIGFGNLSGATLWFNTVHASSGFGVSIGLANTIDFRNNIVTSSGTWGLNAADARFSVISHNLLFGNVSGGCNSCTPGAPYLTTDPLYENAGADDYSLGVGSPATDAGVDVGEPYGGTAPDLGYLQSN
jgi:hypothetical protein